MTVATPYIIEAQDSAAATPPASPTARGFGVDSTTGLPFVIKSDGTVTFTILSTETVQDIVGAMVASSASVTATYDDPAGTITLTVSSEAIQDAVGTILTDSATVDFAYDDAGNQITAAVLDSPLLQGSNGAFYRARANHTGSQLASTISDLTEAVQDVVGALIGTSNTILPIYDDAGNAETLEFQLLVSVVAGANKVYAKSDRGKMFQRSNGGAAMADTLPTLVAGDAGWIVKVENKGTTVAEVMTVTSPSGNFQNGTTTFTLNYGCRQTFVWTGTAWAYDAGNSNLLKVPSAAVGAGNIVTFADTVGRQTADSGVKASALANMLGRMFLPESYGTLTAGPSGATVSGAQATANRTAIQGAIDAAFAAGGGYVFMPPGNFHVDVTINVWAGVKLVGCGRQANTDVGGVAQTHTGTTLFWNTAGGSSTTAVVSCAATSGVSGESLKGAGVHSLNIQCAGGVGIGLRIKSATGCEFSDIYVINPNSRGISCECFVKTTELGEAADNRVSLDNISVRALEVAGATCFYFGGSSNANTSNSHLKNLTCVLSTGIGFDFANSDSNRGVNLVCNIADGGTAIPLIFRANATAGQESRGNSIYGLSPGGSSTSATRFVISEGTDVAAAPAKNNVINSYSVENGEGYPKIGTGSTLKFDTAGGTANPFLPTLANSTVAAETVVASFAIPANFLTASAMLALKLLAQVSSTATLIFKVHCGTAGTTADALVATFATTAAGVANAHVSTDILFECLTAGAAGTCTAGGQAQLAAAVVGPASAAFAAATVNTTVANFITVTVTQSVAQTFTSRAGAMEKIA